jgi:hypothetical protein
MPSQGRLETQHSKLTLLQQFITVKTKRLRVCVLVNLGRTVSNLRRAVTNLRRTVRSWEDPSTFPTVPLVFVRQNPKKLREKVVNCCRDWEEERESAKGRTSIDQRKWGKPKNEDGQRKCYSRLFFVLRLLEEVQQSIGSTTFEDRCVSRYLRNFVEIEAPKKGNIWPKSQNFNFSLE